LNGLSLCNITNVGKNLLKSVTFYSITKAILKLLQRNPAMRLGSGKGDAEEIKAHEYFRDVNWDDIYFKFYFFGGFWGEC